MNATRFRIRKNGKYGFIDESGNETIEPIFEYANDFKTACLCDEKDFKGTYFRQPAE